ncbi:hypothetical protein NST17_19910 [Caldifermentibacillus hisashii]|uniref:FbpB family small basic protein n=1 Tax=Caldifermentibacillus hisashii TaxID=996558 RepID=A0ABU9K2R4_9BACI
MASLNSLKRKVSRHVRKANRELKQAESKAKKSLDKLEDELYQQELHIDEKLKSL